MKTMSHERGVTTVYNAKYEGVEDDTAESVAFKVNGKVEHASFLIGADGIYSSVRQYLSTVRPEYTGVVGVLAHINSSTVSWPYPDYEKACTIQGKPGAIFFIPEVADGAEIMVGMQIQHHNQDRTAWEALAADKDRLCEFYRADYEDWGATAKSIIDAVCESKDTLYLWPFLRMPKLERWFSKSGRVILIGDAAHAVPPSSGQGVNQSLEDVYSLTMLLKSPKRREALEFWQELRQARIDAVFDWATNATNVQRLPDDERLKKMQEPNDSMKWKGNIDDMRWLYQYDVEQQVNQWLESNA